MQVGDQIGQYAIVEHIGRGGMADVWSARDGRLQRTVAIKTIVATLADERNRAQFEHEARTIAALEHSHILPIYDFGDYERQLYIVMRYVSGGSLLDRIIDRGHLADDEVVRVGEAIALALERAHAEQVVHRDLKPANVLLDRFGTPYLADFGLAAMVGAGEDESASAGTLIYMPPEQMFGQLVDHRTDIYAFAITIFQMLTGEFPFEGQTALCLKQMQEGGQLPDPRQYRPDLPEHILTVLRMATALDISARFDSARLFMDEVKGALLGHTAIAGERRSTEYGPAQEDPPYVAQTDAAVGEDLIVTMPGEPGAAGLIDPQDTLELDLAAAGPRRVNMDLPTDAAVAGTRPVGPQQGDPSQLDEARQLYARMVRVWARGQGRFLTGATHFATIHSFYSEAARHGLALNDAGREALLRGAVEHDYAVEHWLAAVPNVSTRRTIFLHALRSDLAAARALAVRLLVDVPDGDGVPIAITVARLLHSETSPAVRRAIVVLLAARLPRAEAWQAVAYDQDTDLLLAEQALRTDAPDVAELAARTVGRLRSRAAVAHIAAGEAESPAQARAALAFVRDETDRLPEDASPVQRRRAALRLTGQYLRRDIGRFGLRFLLALLGAGLGLGIYVFYAINTDQRTLLRLDLLYTTIANGQTFGLVAGLGLVLAAALPLRLAGSLTWRADGAPLWGAWARFLAGFIAGGLVGTVAYLNFQYVFLRLPDPQIGTALQGGIGLALGCAIASTLRLPLGLRLPLAALTFFIPLYSTCFASADPLIYFTDAAGWCADPATSDIWRLGLPLAVLAALGAYGPEVLQWLRRRWLSLRGL